MGNKILLVLSEKPDGKINIVISPDLIPEKLNNKKDNSLILKRIDNDIIIKNMVKELIEQVKYQIKNNKGVLK